MRRPLYMHQRQAFNYAMKRNAIALFIEMRLGKSLIVIRVCRFKKINAPILIVAPSSAQNSWLGELTEENEQNVVRLHGAKAQRIKQIKQFKNFDSCERSWLIINPECYRSFPNLWNYPWGCIVCDESTFLANPSKKTANDNISQSYFYISKFRHVKHRYILTGTPAPESELQYFGQLEFLDPSILPFVNYWDFRASCFGVLPTHEHYLLSHGRKLLAKKLKKHCFLMTRKDAGIPDKKIYQKRYVELSPKMRKAYNIVVKDFILTIDNQVYAATKHTINIFQWLRNICGGYIDDQFLFDGKYREVLSLLKGELKNESVVIFATYLKEINKLIEVLTKKKIKLV